MPRIAIGSSEVWDLSTAGTAAPGPAVRRCGHLPAGELVEGLRRVKDAGEIDRIRRACAIADDAFQSLLPMFGERPTEQGFALALEFAMRERGASGNSFDPIIASGPNGSKPHHVPTGRVIERLTRQMTRVRLTGGLGFRPRNTARRLHEAIEATALRPRPFVSIRRDRQVHDPRPFARGFLRAEPFGGKRAGPIALEENIGVF